MAKSSVITVKLNTLVNGQKEVKEVTMELAELSKSARLAINEAKGLSGAFKFDVVATAISQVQSAVSEVASAVGDLCASYAVQETAERQLETAMRNTMGATKEQIQSIKDLCSAQQEMGVIGDEVQLRGAQELATYLSETDTLKKLIPVMNDMVAQQYGLSASGENAAQIATMLGKVMNGQVGALSRYGYSFTDAQAQILKFGTEAERASVLAQVVGESVGGMNAELAKTDSGKMKQLENAIGDVKENLGKLVNGAMPFLSMASAATIAVGGVMKLYGGIKTAYTAVTSWRIKQMAMNATVAVTSIVSKAAASVVNTFSAAMKNGTLTATALKFALRGLLISTGIGAAIWAVTTAIEYFCKASDEAKDSVNDLIDAEKRSKRAAEELDQMRQQERSTLEHTRAALSINISRLKDFNGTKEQERELVSEMNDTYGETMGYFSKLSDWYKALTANSEAYCRQIVLESRARMLANQIAQKQQENYDITHNEDGSKRKYSTKRKTYQDGQQLQGYDSAGNAIYTPGITKEISGTSALEKAQAAYEDNNKAIAALTEELNRAAAEVSGIDFSVKGSSSRPYEGTSRSTATSDNGPAYRPDAKNLKEYRENIQHLNKELETATPEQAEKINYLKGLWQSYIDEIEKAGSDIPETFDKMGGSSKFFTSNMEGLGKTAKDLVERFNATPVKAVNPLAVTLKDICDNINILQEQLQTATIEEAAMINRQIEMWEKKSDAIRHAGEEAKLTFDDFRSGWGGIKGIAGAFDSVKTAVEGNNDVLTKGIAIVDAMISVYDGVKSVIDFINLLQTVTELATCAKVADTAATVAQTSAATVQAASGAETVASDVAVVAANKAAAASFIELAAASYFAAHAYIPFAGFAIASGFATSAALVTKSMGLMAFADGGIAYGPTLGLFGEYAGAASNPEVVAPLDKLRSLIEPSDGIGGEVEFKIKDDYLYGILKRKTNKLKRTLG